MAWVVSMEMDENTCNPFLIYGFFSSRKILMIGIFDLISDFSKETHPHS